MMCLSNPSITIINIYIGYGERNSLDFTDSHRRYAARNGYEYKQITENLLPGAKPTWSKHPAALEIIREREAVMIIDSDAEILPRCPPFHELVRDNSQYDLFFALGHSFRPNAGMILLRGGSSGSEKFLEALLENRLNEIPLEDRAAVGGDNGHVINLLRHQPFRDMLFILPPTWNNTSKPNDWDNIRHYTGPMREWFSAQKTPLVS